MTKQTEFKDYIKTKLLEHLNLSLKHEAIVKAVRKASGVPWKKLLKNHSLDCKGCVIEEIQTIETKSLEIQKEIQGLLAQSSYFLFDDWSDIEIKLLRVYDENKTVWTDTRKRSISQFLDMDIWWVNKDDIVRRLLEIPVLFSNSSIDLRLKRRYEQIIKCHIFGLFEPACILSRTFAESLVKKHIENKGYSDLLSGGDKSKKTMTIPEILVKYGLLENETLTIYRKICGKADHLLHNLEAEAQEKASLESIQLLQKFVFKFPKSL